MLSILSEPHVAQHHDSTQEQGCGVCFILPCNVGGRSMDLQGKEDTHIVKPKTGTFDLCLDKDSILNNPYGMKIYRSFSH